MQVGAHACGDGCIYFRGTVAPHRSSPCLSPPRDLPSRLRRRENPNQNLAQSLPRHKLFVIRLNNFFLFLPSRCVWSGCYEFLRGGGSGVGRCMQFPWTRCSTARHPERCSRLMSNLHLPSCLSHLGRAGIPPWLRGSPHGHGFAAFDDF